MQWIRSLGSSMMSFGVYNWSFENFYQGYDGSDVGGLGRGFADVWGG
jgi:hypothetical protein